VRWCVGGDRRSGCGVEIGAGIRNEPMTKARELLGRYWKADMDKRLEEIERIVGRLG
jgi:hypothetical protein